MRILDIMFVDKVKGYNINQNKVGWKWTKIMYKTLYDKGILWLFGSKKIKSRKHML